MDNDTPFTPVHTTAEIRKIAQAGDLMAPYTQTPVTSEERDNNSTWEAQMRRRLSDYAHSLEIREPGAVNLVVAPVFSILAKTGRMGNVDEAFRLLRKEVKQRKLNTLAFSHPGVPRSALTLAPEARLWLKEHYAFTQHILDGIMKNSAKGENKMTAVQWLANLHSQAEQERHNRGDQYKMHWFNTSAVIAFLIHFHTVCDERGIEIKQRSRTLNQILHVPTPFAYTGTGAQARTLVDDYMKTVPAAAPPPADGDSGDDAPAADTSEATAAFGPKRSAGPTKETNDDPAIRSWGSLWPALKSTHDLFDVPDALDSFRPEIHRLFGVASMREFPKEISNAELVAKLKVILEHSYQLKEQNDMALTQTKPTEAEWVAWRTECYPDIPFKDDNGGPNILRYLNAASMKANQGPVTKLSEWNDTLIEAARAVEAGRQIEQPIAPAKSASQMTPDEIRASDPEPVAEPSAPATELLPVTPIVPGIDPVRVYPLPGASYIYGGVTFAVTLGLGGTMDMADALCDQWLLRRERIAPTCFVENQRKAEVHDPNLKHEECFAIKRNSSPEGQDPMYLCYFLLANGTEAQTPFKVSAKGKNREILEAALREAGIDFEAWKDNARQSIDFAIYYRKGAEVKGSTLKDRDGNPARHNDIEKVVIGKPEAAAKAS